MDIVPEGRGRDRGDGTVRSRSGWKQGPERGSGTSLTGERLFSPGQTRGSFEAVGLEGPFPTQEGIFCNPTRGQQAIILGLLRCESIQTVQQQGFENTEMEWAYYSTCRSLWLSVLQNTLQRLPGGFPDTGTLSSALVCPCVSLATRSPSSPPQGGAARCLSRASYRD